MNVYELAEQMDSWASDVYGGGKTLTDAANMLRQQTDRIAKLESYLEAYKTRVAELEKMPTKYCPTENNAAYEKGVIDGMAKQRQSRVDGIIGQIGDSPIHDLVHRTTPQIKELSDEEIMNLYKETEADNGGIREFAKAILKKASEK
jgi:hypothetical protein